MLELALALYLSSPYAIDGDTIQINRERVRLVQINTPELNSCYGQQAREFTQRFISRRGEVSLKSDPALDNRDTYGRALRYLIKAGKNLNLELVRKGYAKPMFYNGVKGKYAAKIEQYARSAKANRLGVWNCKEEGNA